MKNTCRKQSSRIEPLKENRLFNTLFEAVPLGFVIFDAKTGRIYDVNKKFTEIIGRTKEELLAIDWKTMTHPSDHKNNEHSLRLLADQKLKQLKMTKRYLKPDGTIVWANITMTTLGPGIYGDEVFLCMVDDITQSVIKEQDICYLNFHDVLTDLYNRPFYEVEKKRLDTWRQWPLSIIMADINGLRLINTESGYEEGDKWLVAFAEILRKCCRSEDIIARVGGDEFCILLPQTGNDAAEIICERIYKECAGYKSAGHFKDNHISISLGCATKSSKSKSINDIEKEAEDFMNGHKLLERRSVYNSLISSMRATMFEKSHETEAHAERLVSLSRAIGQSLKLQDAQMNELSLLATLHDIGKMSIDDKILNKAGKLNQREWDEMRKHPDTGYRIAQASPELKPIANYIRCHHERWDGNGYPMGIKGPEIPLLSRILAVVDAYDAMTQDRPYRKALAREEAIQEIMANAGTQFDPMIAKVFVEM